MDLVAMERRMGKKILWRVLLSRSGDGSSKGKICQGRNYKRAVRSDVERSREEVVLLDSFPDLLLA